MRIPEGFWGFLRFLEGTREEFGEFLGSSESKGDLLSGALETAPLKGDVYGALAPCNGAPWEGSL